MLTEEQKSGLMPGVKELVIFLNKNRFPTLYSDDGTGENEDSCSFPMIAFDTSGMDDFGTLLFSKQLYRFLWYHGVEFYDKSVDKPSIKFSFNPAVNSCTVVLYNTLSEDVDMETDDE